VKFHENAEEMAMSMTGNVSPRPLRASKSAISKFAEQVAEHVRYSAGASMHELISRLNGRISYSDLMLPTQTSPEAIVVKPDRSFHIFLPTVTSPERDRFTIAHELGHFFLHFPAFSKEHPGTEMRATRSVSKDDLDQQRAEWEANWFAASFLMPEDDFRAAYAKGASFAAGYFGVSGKAVEVRAKSLELA
jgi:hypothetical protein